MLLLSPITINYLETLYILMGNRAEYPSGLAPNHAQLAQSYLDIPDANPIVYPVWNPKFKVGDYIKTHIIRPAGDIFEYKKIETVINETGKFGFYVFDDKTTASGPHIDNGNDTRAHGPLRQAAELSSKAQADADATAKADAKAKADATAKAIIEKNEKIVKLLANNDVRREVYNTINISNPIKTNIVGLTPLHPWNAERNNAAIGEYLVNLGNLDYFDKKYLRPGGKPRSRKTKKRTGKKSIKNKRKSNRHRRR